MKNNILKTIVAALVGEIALILLTTLAQEVLFDGISYTSSNSTELFLGGLATFIAAVLAGVIASLIGGRKNPRPHQIISIIIITEMSYLIIKGITKDPVWFDVLSGLSLIVGVWCGYLIMKRK